MREKIVQMIEEMAEWQKEKLFRLGREIVPYLTDEDLLQPMDYPQIENNPHFRYEEGVLDGIRSVQMALFALLKEEDDSHVKPSL